MRKSIKIFDGLRLNFSKSGISSTIGPRGATLNKKLLSTKTTDTETTDDTPQNGGFNAIATLAAFIGIGLCFSGLPWWIKIFTGLFGLAGAMILLMDTILDPRWLWFVPLISAATLFFEVLTWWWAVINWLILIIGVFCLIVKFMPTTCFHCREKIKDENMTFCPHCHKIWNSNL